MDCKKSAKNLHFWAFWAKMANFGQNGQNGYFSKKRLETFSRLQALTNCKVSEKSNEQFSRNCVKNGRTNGRDSLGHISSSWSGFCLTQLKKSDRSEFHTLDWPNAFFYQKICPWNETIHETWLFQAFMPKNGPKWAFFRCQGPQICVFKDTFDLSAQKNLMF